MALSFKEQLQKTGIGDYPADILATAVARVITDSTGNGTGLVGPLISGNSSNWAQWVYSFHQRSFASRIAYIMSGATPFVSRTRFTDGNGSGFVPDGNTSAALNTALAAAAINNTAPFVSLTQDMVFNGTTVNVPANTMLFCGTYNLSCTSSTTINLAKGAKIVGGKFNNGAGNNITITSDSVSQPNGEMGVIGCWFLNHSINTVYVATSNNTLQQNTVVALCRFDNCVYGVNLVRSERALICMNKFVDSTTNTCRGIGGQWSEKSLIEYNIFDGGICGVLIMAYRTGGRGHRDNMVRRNLFLNITEEAVGIDTQGSSSTEMGVFDTAYVFSTAGSASSNPTLNVPRLDQTGNLATYPSYVVQVLTGTAAGKVFGVNFGGTNTAFVGTANFNNTTAMVIASTTSGVVAAGQAVSGPGVPDGTYVVSGSAPNWVLNKLVPTASGTAITSNSITVRLSPGGNMTSAEFTALTGARIAFMVPMENNAIVENSFYNCVTPISLWGYSNNTTVQGNVVLAARVSPLNGLKTSLSVYGLAGLTPSSHIGTSSVANSQCSIPVNAQIYGNDWGDGSVYFGGAAYAAEAVAVTGVASPAVIYYGDNSGAPIQSYWEQTSSWVSTTALPFTYTVAGAFVTGIVGGWQAGEGPYSPAMRLLAPSQSSIMDMYMDTSGTTALANGATQSTNGLRGRLKLAAGASSFVLGNSQINLTSQLLLTVSSNDTTALIKNYVCAAGSATITMNAGVTADTTIDWTIYK